MKELRKFFILSAIGGILYILLEIVVSGTTHWTMFILGGICFYLVGLIGKKLSKRISLLMQGLIGGFLITILEFISGYILNIKLGMNIWNYSMLEYNILGQISLEFFLIWCLLSVIIIITNDWLRYWIFNEEYPNSKFF